MKSGMIVERRDHVLIGFLSLTACAASTFFTRWASQNGPFFNERVMCYPLFLATAREKHRSRALVATRLLTLGLLAPRRYRMTTGSGLAFTTTMRMVNRVHDHTANGRTNATPTHCTCFTDLAQAMFGIADFAHGCAAFDVHTTHFAGTQTNLRVSAFARHQHHAGAGGTRHLSALARQHFDAMHDGADRNVANRQAVTRLDRRFRAIHDLIADSHAFGGDDVMTLAVCITQQRDVRSAVRVVFDTLALCRDTVLVATEIDHAVMLLMTTADMTSGDVTVIVATGGLRF